MSKHKPLSNSLNQTHRQFAHNDDFKSHLNLENTGNVNRSDRILIKQKQLKVTGLMRWHTYPNRCVQHVRQGGGGAGGI